MPSNTGQGMLDRLLVRPFEEAVVLLFSALAVVFIVPFALIRAGEQAWADRARRTGAGRRQQRTNGPCVTAARICA